MKIKDLYVGQEIIYFDCSYKKVRKAKIVGLRLTDVYDKGTISISYMSQDFMELSETKKLKDIDITEFKSDDFRYHDSWCLEDCTRYIDHVTRVWSNQIQPSMKSKHQGDYSQFDHGNNKRQIEKRLEKQRAFVNRVMEQGYVWFATSDCNRGREWRKEENPKIEFSNNSYYIYTMSGRTKCNKMYKTLMLENPEKEQ